MSSEVNKVRFVLFHDLRGCCSFRLPPDEIHFAVNRAERQSSLENQQHAAVKKKACAGETEHYWYHVVAWIASERHDADRNAGRDKHSQAHIKSDHATLEYSGAAG